MDINRIKSAIAQFPHANQLKQKDLKSWLVEVGASDPSRIYWHLDRATGIGGSDIGVLLLEAMGQTPPFGRTGVQLANDKLLKNTPEAPLPHMMRGIYLEEPLIEAIINIYGGTRDLFSEKAIQEADVPNRNGNVDFYWSLTGQKILVDTKVPISATEAENTGSDNAKLFSYKSQVHHYDLIGESLGIKADKLVIAELDVPVELADQWVSIIKSDSENGKSLVADQMTTLLAGEKPGMRINFIVVEPDLEINIHGKPTSIRDAIPQVADDFMQHLINGEAITAHVEEYQPLTQETQNLVTDTEIRLGNLRAISEYCERESANAQAYLTETLNDKFESVGTYKGDLFNITQKSGLDTDSAISVLGNYPIDLDELRKDINPEETTSRDLDLAQAIKVLKEHGLFEQCLKKPAFDPEKVSQALNAVGENPDAFQKTTVNFRKSTTNAAKQRFRELGDLSSDIDEYLTIRNLNRQHEQQKQVESTQAANTATELKVG